MSEEYTLAQNPAFSVDIHQGTRAVRTVRDVGKEISSGTDEVIQAWRKVTTSFNEPTSNHVVDTAMTSLNDPAESIDQALVSGAKALEVFLGEVQTLQGRHEALESTREGTIRAINAAVKAEDSAEASRLSTAFNEQVRSLQSKFSTACAEAVQDFQRAKGLVRLGSLPNTPGVPREVRYPAGSWKDFTASLDDAFKKDISLDQVAGRLKDMSPEQLKEWMNANPEMAGKLAGRTVDSSTFKTGSVEARIVMLATYLGVTPNLVDTVATLWEQLSKERQAFLLMAFPAFFGNLDGVPFKDRIRTNKLTVVGEKYRVEQRLKELKGNEPKQPSLSSATQDPQRHEKLVKEHAEKFKIWLEEVSNANKALQGLDKALEKNYQLVAVSGEGDGRFAVLRGNLDHAQSVAVSVPGTTTDGSDLQTSVDRLDTMLKGTKAAGIYWQNTDLPDGGEDANMPGWAKFGSVGVDNMTKKYNRVGAPRLAAFDAALDKDLGGRENTGKGSTGHVRTVYVAHSAGASMLGTAEAYGLDSSAIVYVAPAGDGTPSLMDQAGGRGNHNAQRYILQAPEDPIGLAQARPFGTPFHGKNPLDGGASAIELEAGYVDHDKGGPRVTTHDGYFHEPSTAMRNIRGVIAGDRVLPRQVQKSVVPGHTGMAGDKPIQQESLELYPEHYAGNTNWKYWIPVKDLEK